MFIFHSSTGLIQQCDSSFASVASFACGKTRFVSRQGRKERQGNLPESAERPASAAGASRRRAPNWDCAKRLPSIRSTGLVELSRCAAGVASVDLDLEVTALMQPLKLVDRSPGRSSEFAINR